jgi:hypothetical protein
VEPAAVQASRRKVKRAVGLLQEASRELAQLADDVDLIGVHRVYDRHSRLEADELIKAGVAAAGAVDVVIVARPARRTPTTAAHAAKGGSSANGRATGEAAGGARRVDEQGRRQPARL